jgi:hypothetical protein
MEVFNSVHGSNILGCGNLCTAGSQNFKTKEFTWFSEVNYFECTKTYKLRHRNEQNTIEITRIDGKEFHTLQAISL